MKKERVVVEYADTLGELQVKGMKWHHDHAWFHYFGKTKDVPEELKFLLQPNDCYLGIEYGHDFIETTETTATCFYCGEVIENKKYVLLAEEDEPYKPEKNEEN
jgi:hypothetical protein